MRNKTQKDFIELRDVWGNYALNEIKKSRIQRMKNRTFDIGAAKKIQDYFIKAASKKNIVRTICVANACIPGTCFPITNPIIIKVSKKIDERTFIKIKMRFNLQ